MDHTPVDDERSVPTAPGAAFLDDVPRHNGKKFVLVMGTLFILLTVFLYFAAQSMSSVGDDGSSTGSGDQSIAAVP